MKKILALILLLTFSAASLSQEQAQLKTKTKHYYLTKSNDQKTIGFVMLGAGIAAMAGGAALAVDEMDLGNMWGPEPTTPDNSLEAGEVLFIAGGASAVGSIFMFIASGNNKKRANAMAASFKMEKGVPPMLRDIGPTYYPALSIIVPIK